MIRQSLTRNQHPSVERLARLVSDPAADDDVIIKHLAMCPRCMGLYAEFVHARSVDTTDTSPDPVPAEWLRRGLAVAAARPEAVARVALRRPLTVGRFAGFAAAAALIGIASFFGIEKAREQRREGLLAEAMRRDSYGGLVYGESFLPIPSGYRGVSPDPQLDGVLVELARYNDKGPRTAEQAFWLVSGFLSRNELENADATLREARLRFAADDRLTSLAAILAYKRNDLPTAAQELEAALQGRRTAAHLYNLARVRMELGDSTAAAALGHELIDRHPGSPLVSMTLGAPESLKPPAAPAPLGSRYSRDSVPAQ